MVRSAGRRLTALHRRRPPGSRKAAHRNRGRLYESRQKRETVPENEPSLIFSTHEGVGFQGSPEG